ncbi:MAG: adenylate/guanylate cyclase domain-containing protein [Gammaproteobacteria bacterium]
MVAKTRTWIWRFDSPVDDIWPVLGDTARFNEAAGLPKHTIEEIAQPDGSVRYRARARIGLFQLRWEEQPVSWVDEQWFEHCRHFENGPLRYLCATLKLIPQSGGCRCEYTVDVEAANALGKLLLATGFFAQIGRTFTRLADNAREFARGERQTGFECKTPALAAGAHARAQVLVSEIEATPHGHGLAHKLADFILTRQEVDVWAIRPLKLARLWQAPPRQAVELCLEAARQGLLGLRWDLLCPRCQVGKSSVLALDQLPEGAHCSSCNIDYARDYTDNIELAFYPASAIRPLESGEYCLFGPMSTPHIKVQLTLAPGEHRTLKVDLPHGSYRLRTLEPGGEHDVQWEEGGFPTVIADGENVAAEPSAGAGELALHNNSARKLTLIVEERQWRCDALTAKRATAMQAFRDLFTKEVLRPGDNVEVDHITIMFTDLKGSSALYERIGDPQAYYLVREHFAILGKAVRQHDGAIVKTIGDAIMAVFNSPADALRCGIQIHADFERFNAVSGKEPITVKLGIHVGRCIAVTLNNRLDYYGTAANKAARLEAQSTGGDIVMSPEFAGDPLVTELLRDFSANSEQARLKGFDEPVRFMRISADDLSARRQSSEQLLVTPRRLANGNP